MNHAIFKGFSRKVRLCLCLAGSLCFGSCKLFKAVETIPATAKSYRLTVQMMPGYWPVQGLNSSPEVMIYPSLAYTQHLNAPQTGLFTVRAISPDGLAQMLNHLNQAGLIVESVTPINENQQP